MKKIAFAMVVAALASPVVAAPVQNPDNGHWYEYVGVSLNGPAARSAALAATCTTCGAATLSGYLATVTSAVENAFLVGLSGDGLIGGSDAAVEGVWTWMDGPEAGTVFWNGGISGSSPTFASWNSAEPNNLGDEDYIQLNNGRWNDLRGTSTLGYFVEYSAAAVPLPAALPMLGLGLAGLGLISRRKA